MSDEPELQETAATLSAEEIRAIVNGKPLVDAREEFERARLAQEAAPEPQPTESTPDRSTPASAPAAAKADPPQDSEPESTTEPVAQTGPEDLDLATRLDLMERELQLRDVLQERQQLENEKWKYRAQTRAGELDYLRKTGRPSAESDPIPSELYETDEYNTGNRSADDARFRALEEDAVERAKEKAIQKFSVDFKDFEQDDRFRQLVAEKAPEYAAELQSGHAKKVQKATEMLLRDARIERRIEMEQTALEEARSKQSVRSETIRNRKLATAPSDSSGDGNNSTTPAAGYADEQDRLMKMPLDQLAQEVNRLRRRR